MKKLVYLVIIVFVFLIYIYDISFRAFPIGGRSLLSVFGLVLSIKYFLSRSFKIRKEYGIIILLFVVCIIWDIITSTINNQSQFKIIHTSIFQIIYIFGAFFLYKCHNNIFKFSNSYIETIAVTVFVESILCIVMKFNYSIFDFFDSILVPHSELTDNLDIEGYYRFVGIGNATYFSVLPSCIIGSVCSIALVSSNLKTKKLTLFLIMFSVISIVSFFVARTSAVAAIISVFLLFYNMGLDIRKLFSFHLF